MTGEKHRHVLYEQSCYPVFQNRLYDSASDARKCLKGDIRLVQDHTSGLVHNELFRPELMTYDESYQNEQAHSKAFRLHLEAVAGIVRRRLGVDGIVEIGCGKGYFLEFLSAKGFDISGFDPAYEGSNPLIRKEPFQPTKALVAEGLVLRHVLEHVGNPYPALFVKASKK